MARQQCNRTLKGKPFAVEWPEYFVECADENCSAEQIIAALGECFSRKDANKKIKMRDTASDFTGWKQKKQLWYCPKHD